uniref:Uncharacterized protein n=1 Tax=Branchiostoma floridae TaxID=7739 RepID=C3XTK8_BRAFL|eukprot:XP_002612625.1 hypothetical protein BRAFLDRAFT_78747 [Branchiostoma floridae]
MSERETAVNSVRICEFSSLIEQCQAAVETNLLWPEARRQPGAFSPAGALLKSQQLHITSPLSPEAVADGLLTGCVPSQLYLRPAASVRSAPRLQTKVCRDPEQARARCPEPAETDRGEHGDPESAGTALGPDLSLADRSVR